VERVGPAPNDCRGDQPVLVGSSPPYLRALHLAQRFAPLDISMLLLGETGTGKELFARAIHAASRRSHRSFVPVDCSTLTETLIESELFGHEKGSFTGAIGSRIGRFELAQGGTLFLDEIGNLPLGIQAKLLRVLQSRQLERVGGREPIRLDVRLVAATNVDLEDAIAAGRFRQDLYFRLQEMTINLPPLRERPGDISRLAEHFAGVYARRFDLPVRGISCGALDLLEAYSWPGNARELENAMKSAVILASEIILPEHLPPAIMARDRRSPMTVRQALHLGLRTPALGLRSPDAATPEPAEAAAPGGDRVHFEFELGLRGGGPIDLKALGARAAEQAERSLIQTLIRQGSRSSAHLAKRLSVDPKTLRLKLRRYGLDAPLDGRRLPFDPLDPLDAAASPAEPTTLP
jgi:transcriptional regulator with GAF, ATPase, and Fis domain